MRHYCHSNQSSSSASGVTNNLSLVSPSIAASTVMFQNDQSTPRFKVLIIGGSYAGLSTALNLMDLHRGKRPRQSAKPYVQLSELPDHEIDITIVDERDGFYHLIGSPLAMASLEYAKQAWVKFQNIPALKDLPINIFHGSIIELDSKGKKAVLVDNTSERTIEQSYDFLVAASGLRRVWPVVPQARTQANFLIEIEDHVSNLNSVQDGIVIIGGGAVGIEMAAKFKMRMPNTAVTLVHSRDRLLSSEPLPEDFQKKALQVLRDTGVEVLLDHRLTKTSNIHTSSDNQLKVCLEFANGNVIFAGKVIFAISKSIPSTSYLPTSALSSSGYVKVLPNLMFQPGTPNNEDHFAAGDLTQWPGIKRCGGAMHMGQMVAQNIHQRLIQKLTQQKPSFIELEEFPPMMAIAIGTEAIAYAPHTGTTSGPEVLETYFGNDMALSICSDTMQLKKGN